MPPLSVDTPAQPDPKACREGLAGILERKKSRKRWPRPVAMLIPIPSRTETAVAGPVAAHSTLP